MNPAGSRPSPGSSHPLGYDVVRLAAMVCVVAQHVLSISVPGALAATWALPREADHSEVAG
jgi:hypothetical protein